MTKELIDLAWSVLPKEFKEEVRKKYQIAIYDSQRRTLEFLFGKHNLTSDAEGEEMLTVPRKKVQEIYSDNCVEIHRECVSSSDKDCYKTVNEVLKTLFGVKCLLDENSSNFERLEKNDEPKPAKPKFKSGDLALYLKKSIVRIIEYHPENQKYYVHRSLDNLKFSADESELEPYNGTNFHEGDKVIINAPKSDLHGKVGIVKYLDHVDDGMIGIIYDSEKCAYAPNDCLEPYTEPKFKVGDTASYVCSPTLKYKCTVTKVMQNKHSDKWEYNVMYEWGKPGMWIPESDLEPYTELDKESRNLSQDNKSVDNDLKDTHQNESLFGKKLDCTMTGRLLGVENLRLKIAAMAMQGILSNGDWGDYRGGNDQEVRIAKASFGFADALIAESKLSMQPLSCTNDSDNGID